MEDRRGSWDATPRVPGGLEETARRWYAQCIGGYEQILTPGGRSMPYEPRSAWGCPVCQSVLVGLKSGHLYGFASGPDSAAPASWSLEEVGYPAGHRPFRGGVQSVNGCIRPGCRNSSALVGDGSGNVHVYENGVHRKSFNVSRSAHSRVISVKRISSPVAGEERSWCFSVTSDKKLLLHALPAGEVSGDSLENEFGFWWVRREGVQLQPVDREEDRWILVTNDGRVKSIRFEWTGGTPHIRMFDVGRLRGTPRFVACDRKLDRIRSLVYGTNAELRVAALDEDGIRVESSLLSGQRIHFVRILKIFGIDHLIACGEDGQVWSRPWDHPEDTSEEKWFEWRRMPSDVLFVQVDERRGDEQDDSVALLICRDHSAWRVPLFNYRKTLLALVEGYAASKTGSDEPGEECNAEWAQKSEKEKDEVCFAEVTSYRDSFPAERLEYVARIGGIRTLEAIVKRIGRFPVPSPGEALRVGVAVALEAAQHGIAEARSLAQRLHNTVWALLREHEGREGEPSARRSLEAWAIFLKKHFLMAYSFSDKRERLAELEEMNLGRPTPDALIYQARRRTQGFDVLWEMEIDSPVLDVSATVRDGRATAALVHGSGGWRVLKLEADGRVKQDNHPWSAERPKRVFGNYSRVIARDPELGWLVAPRKPVRVPETAHAPRWSDFAEEGGEHEHQAYSILRLDSGKYLLGLRDLDQPLAEWDAKAGTVARPIPLKWGTSLHVRQAITGGERRVWAMQSIGAFAPGEAAVGERRILAFGCEDGYLRLASEATVDGRVSLTSMVGTSQFLGSPIRCLTRYDDMESERPRELLFAGTETGDVFGYEVVSTTRGEVELRLKFRDLLPGAIVSLFTVPHELAGGERAAWLCALEDTGVLTPFELHGRSPGFLGRRTRQYRVSNGATRGACIGDGRIVVCGWNRRRSKGRIRLIQLDLDEDATRGRALSGLEEALTASGRFCPERPEDLLAAFPLGDSSLRSALVERRLGEDWDAARLRDLRDQALRAYPDDLAELDALLLAAVRGLAESEAPEKRIQRLCAIYEVLIRREGTRPEGWTRNEEIQIRLVRHLLNSDTIALWHPAGLDLDELGLWIDRNLRHRQRVVQIVTLRALTEALIPLRRAARTRPEVLRSALPEGVPPVASFGWILGPITRFLYAHPSTFYGSECDASTWAAVSVLVNLLRLLPDSALVIFDHISVANVDPLVFAVMQRRFGRSPADALLEKKLRQYIPWIGGVPGSGELIEKITGGELAPLLRWGDGGREELFQRLGVDAGPGESRHPDADFLDAYGVCYGWIAHLATQWSPESLEKLAALLDEDRIQSAPDWAKKLSDRRDKFFQYTARWLIEHAKPCLEKIGEDHQAAKRWITEKLDALDREAYRAEGERAIFEPELGIAKALLRHWIDVLSPPLPSAGGEFGPYLLGEPLQDHPLVFAIRKRSRADSGELVSEPTVPQLLRIAIPHSREEGKEILKIWKRMQEEQSLAPQRHLIPRIHHVVEYALVPGVSMERVEGRDLALLWKENKLESPRKTNGEETEVDTRARWLLAYKVVTDVSDSLRFLHMLGIAHGDVALSNIVREEGADVLWLVDFDRCTTPDRLRALGGAGRTVRQSYRYLGSRIESGSTSPPGFDEILHRDLLATIQIAASLISNSQEPPKDLDVDKAPEYLAGWPLKLARRWRSASLADTNSWSADEIYREATEEPGQAIYLAGVNKTTEGIRDRVYEELAHERWILQQKEGVSGHTALRQIAGWIRRSGLCIFFLGADPGTPIPAETFPTELAEHLAARFRISPEAIGSGKPLTYTQFEYLLAQLFGKRGLYFGVDEGPAPPSDNRLQEWILSRHRGEIIPIGREDPVALVRKTLRDVMTKRR